MKMKSLTVESDVVIVGIIIIGAFFLIGGQFLLSGLGGFGIAPFKDQETSTNPTPGSGDTNNSDWSIEQVLTKASCDNANNNSRVELAFKGTAPGFYRIDIKNGNSFQPVFINHTVYNEFKPNTQNIQVNDLTLTNADGFNTKPWRVVLFQGGTISGNDLTGGTQKADREFPATNCP